MVFLIIFVQQMATDDPKNVDFSLIDHFEKVTDKDGALMARRISREEGIMVGYSAGSAVAGVNQLKDSLKQTDVVVIIFHDHVLFYVFSFGCGFNVHGC